MKAATLSEIKKELNTLEPERLLELCMRLAKFKKESKELLTYILFESHNESAYIETVKIEINGLFNDLHKSNLYFVRKGLRKILRILNRQIKFSGIKQTEVELRIYFCGLIHKSVLQNDRSQVLINLYQQQLKKIASALATLPEDLQFDYQRDVMELN